MAELAPAGDMGDRLRRIGCITAVVGGLGVAGFGGYKLLIEPRLSAAPGGGEPTPKSDPVADATATLLAQFNQWKATEDARRAVGTPTYAVRVTSTPTETQTSQATATEYGRGATETVVATRTPVLQKVGFSCDVITDELSLPLVLWQGIPENVSSSPVLTTKQDARFTNTIGFGSEAFLAEPGVLAATLKTPKVDPKDFSTGIGGFTLVSFQEGSILFPELGKGIGLRERQDHMYFVIIREQFPVPNSKNVKVRMECSVPNHVQIQKFPSGAFLSEGQFKQIAEAAHTGKNIFGQPNDNCGGKGCNGLTVVYWDRNTDARLVLHQEGVNGPWQKFDGNWKK